MIHKFDFFFVLCVCNISNSAFKYYFRHTEKLEIYGEASAKANLYRDRFQLLLQSISRDKNFSKPTFDAMTTDGESSEVFK